MAALDGTENCSGLGGNAVTAASLAVLQVLQDEKLPENAFKVGGVLKAALVDLQKRQPCPGDGRGRGLVIGLELVDPQDGYTPAPQLTKQITLKAAERGLMLGKVGLYGNVIRVAPPLVIREEEALLGVGILENAITEAMK